MHRQSADKQKLLARLKRAQGQLSAVHRMVDEDEDCVDVLVQISAVKGALDRVAQIMLSEHIEHCVSDALRSDDAELRSETIARLVAVCSRYQRAPPIAPTGES